MLVESNPNGPPDTQRLSAPSGKPDGAHGARIVHRIPSFAADTLRDLPG